MQPPSLRPKACHEVESNTVGYVLHVYPLWFDSCVWTLVRAPTCVQSHSNTDSWPRAARYFLSACTEMRTDAKLVWALRISVIGVDPAAPDMPGAAAVRAECIVMGPASSYDSIGDLAPMMIMLTVLSCMGLCWQSGQGTWGTHTSEA